MNTYFTAPLSGLNDYNLIKAELNGSSVQSSIQVTGAADSGMAHFSAALGSNYKYKVIVTFSDVRAREIYDDMIQIHFIIRQKILSFFLPMPTAI